MDIIIDKVRPNITIIDKDENTFAKGSNICNININNDNDSFNNLINVICAINGFNDIESVLYKYTINDIIANNYKMKTDTRIVFDKHIINELAKAFGVSDRTISRGITSLCTKEVLMYCFDDNCNIINTKYDLSPKYDITPYYNDIEYITIKL